MTTQAQATPASVTSFGRVSFPCLVTPRAMEEGQKKKYSIILLFPNADPFLAKAQEQVNAAMVEKWGADVAKQPWFSKLELPIHDGAEKDYDGYDGDQKFIRFSSQRKPRVVDQTKRDMEADVNADEIPGLYPGCWARVSYNVYAWEHKQPKTGVVVKRGISFGLFNVQKVRDDEAFGGGHSDVDADFDEIEIDDDAAGLLD